MKHLKLFEIKNNYLWVAIIIQNANVNDPDAYIFETDEDMENFILDYINSDLSGWIKKPNLTNYQNYEIDDDGNYIFTDFQSAMNWISEGADYNIIIYEKEILKNIKVPENVRIYQDLKKYNL